MYRAAPTVVPPQASAFHASSGARAASLPGATITVPRMALDRSGCDCPLGTQSRHGPTEPCKHHAARLALAHGIDQRETLPLEGGHVDGRFRIVCRRNAPTPKYGPLVQLRPREGPADQPTPAAAFFKSACGRAP